MTTPLSINGISELDFANGVTSITVTNDVATLTFGSSGGTVTHTGALTAGQLVLGNGTDDITVGDLSGDVTTSGSAATTVAKIQTVPVTITSLTTNDVLKYDGTAWVNSTISSIPNANASQIQSVNVNGSASTPAPLDTFVYVSANSDWESVSGLKLVGSLYSSGTTAIGTAYGFVFTVSGSSAPTIQGSATTQTGVIATATTPPMTNFKTNVAASNSAGWNNGGTTTNLPFLGNVRRIKYAIRLSQTTAMRIWFGLSGGAASGVATFQSDTPNTTLAAFRYSTAAGDTKYQCVTATSSGANSTNAESTATHVDSTTLHIFEIQYDGTNVIFLIDNVKVGQQSTNMPTAVQLAPFVFIDNVGAGAQKAFDFAYSIIECRQ
jgi:hypothetical protein